MKTKFSFSKNHTSLLVATATLLLLSMQSTTFAGSATWDLNPGTGDWNNNSNWTPNTGFPNGAADVATFDVSNTTGVSIALGPTVVAGITFNSGASAFTITVDPTITLTISGTGITNNSGITQSFVTAVSGLDRGVILFTNSATAGSMTAITNNGSASNIVSTFGGQTRFFNSATAGSATITNNGGTVSGGFAAGGGATQFFNSATAGSATITNNGGAVSGAFGGETLFHDTATAGSATLIANGGVSGAFAGFTDFLDTATAGSATLIANGGVSGAAGGSIFFVDNSTGGTASVDVRNNGGGAAGNLDISSHFAPGVTIGSLEGSGNVFLGANNLTVGSNNANKTFSGVIQDGGVGGGTGGSLTKTGTGIFTLTGANTYTSGTTVNAGSLFVNNTSGSGTGTGNVTVTAIGADIGTLGGNGTISGLVTVNGGATLAPGPTGDGSTGILHTGTLTLNSDSNFSLDLNGPLAGTNYDQVDVTGEVFITGSNLLINTALGLAVGDQLFILENDGTDAVTGTFTFNGSSLANGATFSAGGDTFQIFYNANGGAAPLGPAVGNDIELSVVSTAVPEPTTWIGGALAIPFIVFVYIQRRRRAQMFAWRLKANSVVAV